MAKPSVPRRPPPVAVLEPPRPVEPMGRSVISGGELARMYLDAVALTHCGVTAPEALAWGVYCVTTAACCGFAVYYPVGLFCL